MELLSWHERPRLRRPALVAAFEGWNDAGNAASGTVEYLSRQWGAKKFASFSAEELFDFTSARPQVRLESGITRRLEWPEVTLAHAALPDQDRDVVLVSGPEPQLRWRSFAGEVERLVAELHVESAVLVGALLADVPHTRPVRVSGGASIELASLARVEPSYYEGPTGILGVIAEVLGRANVPTVSFWASVPHYVSQSSSPKATLALVERTVRVLGAPVDLVELQIASAAYDRQVDELVASDEDAAAYVSRLEEQETMMPDDQPRIEEAASDSGPKLSPASGERLAAEVERYLREHRRD
ncbi:MAG TPA: PAC2 family protein [Acidimicrobiales bacterium]|nr:PAC2 family protein [Acidimicrobiales bacterium]